MHATVCENHGYTLINNYSAKFCCYVLTKTELSPPCPCPRTQWLNCSAAGGGSPFLMGYMVQCSKFLTYFQAGNPGMYQTENR